MQYDFKTFVSRSRISEQIFRSPLHASDHFVSVRRLMMKQNQLSRIRSARYFTRHRNSRVSESLRRGKALQLSPVMLIQILRIMDQHIHILRKLDETFIRADIAFGIRRIHDGLAMPRDTINE